MSFLPLSFGAPAILFGLMTLPVIWWLLRLTPPSPVREPFAPLSVLARVLKPEETPARSPWWLTLLRLMIAALVILALAEPVLDPRDRAVPASGPLALVVDNGWASAPRWQERVEAAEMLIADAEAADQPVAIVFTADNRHDAVPGTAERARELLAAATPRPLKPARDGAVAALSAGLDDVQPGLVAIVSDGLDAPGTAEASELLAGLRPERILIVEGATREPALATAANTTDMLALTALRVPSETPERLTLTARDSQGRELATGEITFESGAGQGEGGIEAPFEIRNDIARVEINGHATAGATMLIDDSFRRRRVALVSGEAADLSQPLLSPLYYIRRALAPYAELIEPSTADLGVAIPELIRQNPAVIILADIGTVPEETLDAILDWVRRGGTLIRFAGPRLAAAPAGDPLSPVSLRTGERELGGALSWTDPQPLAPYPAESPFFGLPAPDDITVRRQVLADPSPELAERTWASLADGTPLVTARDEGAGRLILFHVTGEATWSNLPISGHFVEMLRRAVQLARAAAGKGGSNAGIFPPWRLMDAAGFLVPAAGEARPLDLTGGATPPVSPENPPGLYGSEDGYIAHNLFRAGETLSPFQLAETDIPVERTGLSAEDATDFRPYLFLLAFLLLIADSIVVMVMNGALRRRPQLGAASAAMMAIICAAALSGAPSSAFANDTQPGDVDILESVDTTRLAYVVTGDDTLDRISQEGLDGLSRILASRTALEPGSPAGVDIENDSLAFYPIIYWPMSTEAPMPSAAAISRIDAYMKNGGTVLFDTRDRIGGLSGAASPETLRLQTILSGLDIPPLEPVPTDHVLTKAFYLLDAFPGRYGDGPLWVEAIATADERENRPARAGDGVSPILITGNDFAAAWASDENGGPLYSTVPPDPWQREFAFRSGINIIMYMLTGNYKADQVHIPALLERLGQ